MRERLHNCAVQTRTTPRARLLLWTCALRAIPEEQCCKVAKELVLEVPVRAHHAPFPRSGAAKWRRSWSRRFRCVRTTRHFRRTVLQGGERAGHGGSGAGIPRPIPKEQCCKVAKELVMEVPVGLSNKPKIKKVGRKNIMFFVQLFLRICFILKVARRTPATFSRLWAKATIPNSVWTFSSPRKEKRRNERLPLM